MLWAGDYDLIRQYQEEAQHLAERERLARQITRARARRRRSAWNRLLIALLGSGGR